MTILSLFKISNCFKSAMAKTKMIAVSPQNWEAIRKWGEYGDTMNTIVSKILNKIDTLPNSNSNDNDDRGPGETRIKDV